ncbi:hypothetical protein N7451_004434 [Penicillium sp. IBT 35674x]|nr:hypothetical protein N7451_004434 [Penicillium sp. IBT 35674x]
MASFETICPVEHRPRPAPYVKSGRRQYQSCDRCRRNRRACDAAALGVSFISGENHYGEHAPKACSSCHRVKKQCTFNWLLSRPKSVLPQSVKRKVEARGTAPVQPTTGVSPAETLYESAFINSYAGGADLTGIGPHETAVPCLNDDNHIFPSPESLASSDKSSLVSQWEQQPLNLQYAHPNGTTTSMSTECPIAVDYSVLSQFTQPESSDSTSQSAMRLETFHYDGARTSTSSLLQQPTSCSIHSGPSDSFIMGSDGRLTDYTFSQDDFLGMESASGISSVRATSRKGSTTTHQSANNNDDDLDLFNSLEGYISQSTNKSLISASLLRIYCDSVENALSCWVSESNCPYQKVKRKERELSHPGLNRKVEMRGKLSIYARVCRLDDLFVPFHRQPMTKAESFKASRALNAAILAFASQWSHASSTKTSFDGGHGVAGQSLNTSTTIDAFAAPFECLIQQSLWHESRRSLLACENMDSFKVIFAQMIFSMTQRPLDLEERERMLESQTRSQDLVLGHCKAQYPGTAADFNTAELHSTGFNPENISCFEDRNLAQADVGKKWDGLTTYLETALRHLASWRRRTAAQGFSQAHPASSAQSAQMPHTVDLQSFDMIFWLGVMCDTTLSALTQRPLVIAEHDCELPQSTSDQALPLSQITCAQMSSACRTGNVNGAGSALKLWGSYLLSPQSLNGDQARWPCSTEDASAILQEAIPIKVLLFRRVARLQTLKNSWTGQNDIEDSISAILSVYQHWTVAYGQFMRDCLADHENLPAKVQSWYIILAGHWHLGCLLAANCIEQIDNASLSENLRRSLRRSSGLVMELKKENAIAISDLAQVSCSSGPQAFRDNAEFHSALSENALLTEPWTVVLIQALEEACGIFLTWLSCQRHIANEQHEWVYNNTNYSDLRSRASSCINALKLLVRKSDTAGLVAATLESQLALITSDKRNYMPSIRTTNGAVCQVGGLN